MWFHTACTMVFKLGSTGQIPRSHKSLSGSFGEILGGKPVQVFLCHRPVSSIHPSNELMSRCLLRWEYETPGRAFCHIWQRFLCGSFKDRFRRHLTTPCGIRGNSLTPKISRLLPGSVMGHVCRDRVFVQASPKGHSPCGILGKSHSISSVEVLE